MEFLSLVFSTYSQGSRRSPMTREGTGRPCRGECSSACFQTSSVSPRLNRVSCQSWKIETNTEREVGRRFHHQWTIYGYTTTWCKLIMINLANVTKGLLSTLCCWEARVQPSVRIVKNEVGVDQVMVSVWVHISTKIVGLEGYGKRFKPPTSHEFEPGLVQPWLASRMITPTND